MAESKGNSLGHDAAAADGRASEDGSRGTPSRDAGERLRLRSSKRGACAPSALIMCRSPKVSASSEEESSTDGAGSAMDERSGPASVNHVLWLSGRRIEVGPGSAPRRRSLLASEETPATTPSSNRPAGPSESRSPGLPPPSEAHPSVASSALVEPVPVGAAPEEEETSEDDAPEDDAAQLQQSGDEAVVAKLQAAVARGEAPLPPGVPSVGAMLHGKGGCRPCFYAHSRVGCRAGAACLFCHRKHEKKKKARPPKHVREDCKSAAKVAFKELDGASLPDAEAQLEQQMAEQDSKAAGYTLAVLRALFKTRADPMGYPLAGGGSGPAPDRPPAAAPPGSSAAASPAAPPQEPAALGAAPPSSCAATGTVAPARAGPAETSVPMPRTLRRPGTSSGRAGINVRLFQ